MGLYKTWFLIMLMFVGVAVGILDWAADFVRHREFSNDGVSVMATRAAESQKPGRTLVVYDDVRFEYPVKFRTEAGQDVSTIAYVPRAFIDKVEATGTAPLIYLRDQPTRLMFPGDLERIPKHYGSLAFAVACLLAGIGLIGIRYRVAGVEPP